MDISQVMDVIENSSRAGRFETFILSDYFLMLNHQRFPLRHILPIIKRFLPIDYPSISEVIDEVSSKEIRHLEYRNMPLSAKQIVSAICACRITGSVSQTEIRNIILALISRYYDIHGVDDDGVSQELHSLERFLDLHTVRSLENPVRKAIWDIATVINPSKRHRLFRSKVTSVIANASDAVLMPTYGVSYELFYNDIIRRERETMKEFNPHEEIIRMDDIFPDGMWLGDLNDSAFGPFPQRMKDQLVASLR